MMRSLIFAAALITAAVPRLVAYTVPTYSYDELFARSDFVVIAQPLRKTHDTAERSTLRGVTPPTPVIGVETQFQTALVLKGRKRDRFTLHHYREPSLKVKPGFEAVTVDGPLLITFDATDRKRYLLFLVRERDGRFAPTGGQQDVETISVQELSSSVIP
jgi:hypothetical protein